jgi:serine O-acetyltransferase
MARGNPQEQPPTSRDAVADALLEDYLAPGGQLRHTGHHELPSIDAVGEIVDQIRALLFPGFVGSSVARLSAEELRELVRERLDGLSTSLRRQVYRGLRYVSSSRPLPEAGDDEDERDAGAPLQSGGCGDCASSAATITARLLAALPELRRLAALDVRAAYEGDPAATSVGEVLFSYPGTYAITVYRAAHALAQAGAPIIPRMMTELAHARTGIDIHPGARIGASFFIDHGTGVVIGETCAIGERVRIYQGVTLGALSVARGAERPAPGVQRHPTIEDDVVIYAGATILGGDTVIGRGAVIGGNAWVTESVAPGLRVGGTNPRRP